MAVPDRARLVMLVKRRPLDRVVASVASGSSYLPECFVNSDSEIPIDVWPDTLITQDVSL
jgi:hypothetical protein